jgi:RimJ/RimL family protein N-acetyltransferase
MQTIVTARLELEPLTQTHAEPMFALLADPKIYRYLDFGPSTSIDQLRAIYAQRETRTSHDGRQIWLNWVLRNRSEDLIGYVQATIDAPGNAWVGYVLPSKCWGHGYAREATGAMIDHLARNYGITTYKAAVEVNNLRSIRVLKKLAFRPAIFEGLHPYNPLSSERLFLRDHGLN